jgi:prepilin-type N-terminal cleavage/methylation domain-containing protein
MRLRSQDGFTLVELLVAIVVGSIVTLAAFALLDRSVVETRRTTDRVDSTQRGRVAMDRITRELRSQVCPVKVNPNDTSPAIVSGDGYSITFWAFFGTRVFTPERYTIAWNAGTQSIDETVDDGAGTPVKRRASLIAGARLPSNVPLFAYYTYPSAGTAEPTQQLAVPPAALSATELSQVSRIDVNFTAVPSGSSNPSMTESAQFSDRVYVRGSDPNLPAGSQGPSC